MVLLSGCANFLDTVPDNRTEIDDIDKVAKLLVNAYPRRYNGAILEARCDGMTEYGTTVSGGQQTETFEFLRSGFHWQPFVPTESDDTYEGFWEDCYASVSYANMALEAMQEHGEDWDADKKKLYTAEAKICRAYAHFTLLSMFSDLFNYQTGQLNTLPGVPFVTETEDRVFKQYDRRTIALTLADIKKDMDEALPDLAGDAAYSQPRFHFTRNAALAFAVRFSLFTRDYAAVINYANELLGGMNVTQWVDETTASTVAEPGTTMKYVSQDDPAYTGIRAKLMDWQAYKSSGTNLYEPGQYFSNPNNVSFLMSSEVQTVTMRTFLGTLLTNYAYNMDTIRAVAGAANPTGTAWALQTLQLQNDHTAFWVKFYEDMLYVNEAAGIGYVYNKVNLFRLEEVLLARAEAKVMMAINDANAAKREEYYQSAIDDLNIFISRKINNFNYANHRLDKDKIVKYYRDGTESGTGGQVGNTGNWIHSMWLKILVFNNSAIGGSEFVTEMVKAKSLIYCVLDFRRVEFMYEGMRYFDILRWCIPVSHTRQSDGYVRTLNPTDDNRVLQIPESAQQAGLQLNPMKTISEPWPGVRYNY